VLVVGGSIGLELELTLRVDVLFGGELCRFGEGVLFDLGLAGEVIEFGRGPLGGRFLDIYPSGWSSGLQFLNFEIMGKSFRKIKVN
jgi:hypothetical protein